MSTLVIEEDGFLKIDGGASVMIDGVELNPKTVKKEPKIELTVEEAKVINKLVYMASCAFILTNEQLDAEEMLEKRIEQAEMSKQST